MADPLEPAGTEPAATEGAGAEGAGAEVDDAPARRLGRALAGLPLGPRCVGGLELGLVGVDPFGTPPVARATRARLAAVPDGARVEVFTRFARVARDVEGLQALAARAALRVHVVFATPDRALARALEPGAPTPARRVQTLAALARAGVPVGVVCAPVLPGATDGPRDLRELVSAARMAGARWFGARVLRLPDGPGGDDLRRELLAAAEAWRPEVGQRWRRWYRGGPGPSAGVEDRVLCLVDALRRQYRLACPWEADAPAGAERAPGRSARAGGWDPRQLGLFGADRAAAGVTPGAAAKAPGVIGAVGVASGGERPARGGGAVARPLRASRALGGGRATGAA